MKRIITCLAAALMSVGAAFGQKSLSEDDKNLLNELASRGFFVTSCQWLTSDDRMESYMRMMHQFSAGQMQKTREAIAYDKKHAQRALDLRKTLVGNTKKAKKQDEALSRYFKDAERARRVFGQAEAVVKRCDILDGAIAGAIASYKESTMPTGRLLTFESGMNNGFAMRRNQLKLWRDEQGKGWLTLSQRFETTEVKAIEVDDSVFQHVRDIVEQKRLYTVGKQYMPDYEIMDASNWSLYIKFEGGSISSGGYASGPDNSLGLNEIESYLVALYRQQVPEEEERGERFMRR